MPIDFTRRPYPPITREQVESVRNDGQPKRIDFQTTHAAQPKPGTTADYAGTLNVPFSKTIGRLLQTDCDITLYRDRNKPGAYWCHFRSKDKYELCKDWKKRQGSRIFLRDCLDLSVALGVNFECSDAGLEKRTRLGDLEGRAKAIPDEEATKELAAEFAITISSLPGYKDAKIVVAVPPSPHKGYDLPSTLADRLAAALPLANLTACFAFARSKHAVKTARVEDKWDIWE